METTILELITKYGLSTVIVAATIFILTSIIKKPIKNIASKMADGTKLTKFITFLPVIIGFGITTLYSYIFKKSITFDGNFFTLWLTSSSLSLAIYAISEKFIPSKKKILEDYEIEQNEKLIEIIKEKLIDKPIAETKIQEKPMQKIILRGSGNGETIDVKKEQL